MTKLTWSNLTWTCGRPAPVNKYKTLAVVGDSHTNLGTDWHALYTTASCTVNGTSATLVTATAHGLKAGDYVRVAGLRTTGAGQLEGFYRVESVPDNYTYTIPCVATGTVENATGGYPCSIRAETDRWGYVKVANWLAGNPVEYLGGYPVWGCTTENMLARFAEIAAAFNPDVIHFLGGTNDITSNWPVDRSMTALVGILDACAQAGIVPVMSLLPPRMQTSAPVDQAGYAAKTVDWNTAAKALYESRKVKYVDYFTPMVDLDNYPFGKPGVNSDYVHTTVKANVELMAPALAPVLAEIFDGESRLPKSASDCGLMTNPLFKSVTTGSGPGFSGTRPVGTSIYTASSGTSSCSTEVVNDPEGYGNIWRVDINTLSNSGNMFLRITANPPGAMAYDGCLQWDFKVRLAKTSGNVNVNLAANLNKGVSESSYLNGQLYPLGDKPLEIEVSSSPVYFKAGDTLTMPAWPLVLTLSNPDTGADSALTVEISRVACRVYERAIPSV